MGRDGRGVKAASKSSIQISFTYQGVECKERIKLQPTAANLKRAERHRAAILLAIEQGTFSYGETFPDSPKRFQFAKYCGEQMFLKDYLDDWISGKADCLKKSTWDGYYKVIHRMLIPAFGHLRLSEVSKLDLKTWLSGMEVSNKRLKNIQSVLRSALQDAVIDDILKENVLHGWTYTRKEEVSEKDDIDPFTAEEQRLILDACDGQVSNLFRFAFWTGLRTSELVALEWGDIDWVRGELCVRRAWTQTSSVAEAPKTKSSVRRVKLLPSALTALNDQKAYTYLKGQEVFQDPRYNERWEGDQPIRERFWTQILRRARVRYRKPYQTRHTYASMLLSSGENPWWIARQMGHSSLAMLEKHYGKWMPEAAPSAGMLAEKASGQGVENVSITERNRSKYSE